MINGFYSSLSFEILAHLITWPDSDSVIFFRRVSPFPGFGFGQTFSFPVLGRSPRRWSIIIVTDLASKSPQYPTTWKTRPIAFLGTVMTLILVCSIVKNVDETESWDEPVSIAQEAEALSFPDSATALNSTEKPRDAMIFVFVEVVMAFVSLVSTPVFTLYLQSMEVSPWMLLHSRSGW